MCNESERNNAFRHPLKISDYATNLLLYASYFTRGFARSQNLFKLCAPGEFRGATRFYVVVTFAVAVKC